MQRREFFGAAGAGLLGAGVPAVAFGQEPEVVGRLPTGDYASVVARARDLAAEPFQPSTLELTGPFANLDYDSYRAIRARAIPLGAENSGFEIDLLPPGFIFNQRVGISLVTSGGVQEIPFSPKLFDFDPAFFGAADLANSTAADALAFSGFRLRYGINRVDYLDEFAVFQGASYFRVIARDTIYGLSARGLAVDTGAPTGEEFPSFRHFWIEQPDRGALSIVVRALLDSKSCAGAFEFDISPGNTTTVQTRCTLFPRSAVQQIGIAPLTSMYVFGPQWRPGVDDFRSAVHDSEGLQMINGQGERLWRPLTNPRQVQVSAFQDANPKAFSLSQRRRDFDHYQDDEALYEKRPTCWVQPIGDWGAGAVTLVEIPTQYEFNDNIVTFWRPTEPLGPTEEGHQFAYCMYWCTDPPDIKPLARVHATRSGRSIHGQGSRVMAVDFTVMERLTEPPTVEASINQGEISGLTMRELPDGTTTRVTFEFSPAEQDVLELQLSLVGPDGPLSERWMYRWTPT